MPATMANAPMAERKRMQTSDLMMIRLSPQDRALGWNNRRPQRFQRIRHHRAIFAESFMTKVQWLVMEWTVRPGSQKLAAPNLLTLARSLPRRASGGY